MAKKKGAAGSDAALLAAVEEAGSGGVVESLLPALLAAVGEEDTSLNFAQATQAMERAFLRYRKAKVGYDEFCEIRHGDAELGEISFMRGADETGQARVIRLNLEEALAVDLPDPEDRKQALGTLLAALVNHHAREVQQCVKELAVYSAVAAKALAQAE